MINDKSVGVGNQGRALSKSITKGGGGKILVVTNQFHPDIGGIQRFSEEFAKFLSSESSCVHVCTLKTQFSPNNDYKYVLHNILVPISSIKNQILYFIINSLILLQLAVRLKPDLILSANYYPTSISNFFPSLILRKKLIVYTHGGEFMVKKKLFVRLLTKLTDKRIDFIIFNSSYAEDIARKNNFFANVKNWTVIHPVFPSLHFYKIIALAKKERPSDNQRNRPIRFLTVCRIRSKKGIHKVIKALYELNIKSRIRYTIIGDGDIKYIQKLREMTYRYGLYDVVTFKGALGGIPLFNEFVSSDIFVMPSYYVENGGIGDFESFGIVYVEALCARLVVIASKESGGPDLKSFFKDQVILVNPYGSNSIKDGILKAIDATRASSSHYNLSEDLTRYFDLIKSKWSKVITFAIANH